MKEIFQMKKMKGMKGMNTLKLRILEHQVERSNQRKQRRNQKK